MNSKANNCQIKCILYPDLNKPKKISLLKNIKHIKKLEKINQIKKFLQMSKTSSNYIYII